MYKILNVVYIFIYFGYFFKSIYSYHQMMATFTQIDTEAANEWSGRRGQVANFGKKYPEVKFNYHRGMT